MTLTVSNSASRFQGDSGKRHLIDVLLKSPVVYGNRDLAQALAEVAEICEFSQGENMITEGTDDNDIFFILRGAAAILIDGIEVRRRTSDHADHIGEMSVIDLSARRSATAMALEPTVAAKISAEDFGPIADAYPKLWRELSVELARRIRQRNEHTKATRHGPVVSPDAPHWKQVVQLLERVPAGLRRWTWEEPFKGGRVERQWAIDNEYHVQNLLYTILAPLFPDITDEVYTEDIGHKRPRVDLLIPSLNLIIEVKFLRANASFATMEGEIAEDATLYRSSAVGKDKKIVAFVWDDSARNEEHDRMKRGVRQMNGIDDIVIISRPGKFSKACVPASTPDQATQTAS